MQTFMDESLVTVYFSAEANSIVFKEPINHLIMITSICDICNKPKYKSWFLVADTIPYKIMSVTVCDGCGPGKHTSADLCELEYGIHIDFRSTSLDNFSYRMNFINTESLVKVFRNREFLMEFKCENAYVDSMSTFIERMIDLIDTMIHSGTSPALINTRNKLEQIINDGIVELEIVDMSGYSRICTQHIEYTSIQSTPIEELESDSCIIYKKFARSKQGLDLPKIVVDKLKKFGIH